jgi:hypothetical protein
MVEGLQELVYGQGYCHVAGAGIPDVLPSRRSTRLEIYVSISIFNYAAGFPIPRS